MKLPAFVALSIAAAINSCANKDGLMSRDDFLNVVRNNALCYELDAQGTCSWAEIYDRFGSDSLFVLTAVSSDFSVVIKEQNLRWDSRRLCLDNEEPVGNVYETNFGAEFWFDLRNASVQDADLAEENRQIVERGTPDNTCFGYVRSDQSDQTFAQITYIDGVKQADVDIITAFGLGTEKLTLRP